MVFLLILFVLPVFLFYHWTTYYSINPLFMPESGTKYHMELTYPPITNGKVKELLLDAQFDIVSNKPMAEGVNITLANPKVLLYGGTPGNERIISNISMINIAFQNAQPMGETIELIIHFPPIPINYSPIQQVHYNIPPGAGFQMSDSDTNHTIFSGVHDYELNLSHGYLKDVRENKPFNFSVSGDYSPSILLSFKDGINNSYESYTYDEIKLHIPSTSEIRTQLFNQLGFIIAIVLSIFNSIEAWRLISGWWNSAPANVEKEDPPR